MKKYKVQFNVLRQIVEIYSIEVEAESEEMAREMVSIDKTNLNDAYFIDHYTLEDIEFDKPEFYEVTEITNNA